MNDQKVNAIKTAAVAIAAFVDATSARMKAVGEKPGTECPYRKILTVLSMVPMPKLTADLELVSSTADNVRNTCKQWVPGVEFGWASGQSVEVISIDYNGNLELKGNFKLDLDALRKDFSAALLKATVEGFINTLKGYGIKDLNTRIFNFKIKQPAAMLLGALEELGTLKKIFKGLHYHLDDKELVVYAK